MIVKIVIACYNKQEHADLVSVLVRCNFDPRSTNRHIQAAKSWATEIGWRGPMICFDQFSPEFAMFKEDAMDWGSDEEIIDA